MDPGLDLVIRPWIAGWFGVAIALIRMRTPIEERLLVERFGDDYRRYMLETARWLPRVPRGG